MTEVKDGGNQAQDDGTQLEQAAGPGTPEAENRNAETGEDWKKLAISLQEKAAKVNELERKLAELTESPPQPPVVESKEVQAKTDQIEDVLARAEEFRKQNDPVAALALENRAELLAMQRDMILTRQLDRVPADEQDQVLKHFNKNRHRLGDINAARSEIREKRLEAENKTLAERLATLEKGPDPEVLKAPQTHGREISAKATKQKMTEAQFDAQAARIRASQGELAYLRFTQENASNVG